MKKILICLVLVCSVFTLNAKTWSVIGKALKDDTTLLEQDASNPNMYKYVGNLTNMSFKLFNGVDYYVPKCGMNDPFDQQVSIEKQVDESQAGFRVSYVNSNVPYRITLIDGIIPKLIVEKVTTFNHLYLIGGPINTRDPNWLLSDARELVKDPENPFVFYYRGFLIYNTFGDEPGSIKFLTSNTNWDPAFHPGKTGNIPLAQASKMTLGGDDTKWELPSDGSGNGYYVLKLNTLNETISIEKFEPGNVEYPAKIFITGDALPCGWNNETPEIMTPTKITEGKYSWTGKVLPGQFKFLKFKGSWGNCWVSTIIDQPVVFDRLYPFVFEAENTAGGNDYKFLITEPGGCSINMDLANTKMFVKKVDLSSTDNTKLNDEVIMTANAGRIVVKCSSSFKKNLAVFGIDGRHLYTNSFVYNSEVSLPKGCYIVKVTDSNGKYNVNKMVI